MIFSLTWLMIFLFSNAYCFVYSYRHFPPLPNMHAVSASVWDVVISFFWRSRISTKFHWLGRHVVHCSVVCVVFMIFGLVRIINVWFYTCSRLCCTDITYLSECPEGKIEDNDFPSWKSFESSWRGNVIYVYVYILNYISLIACMYVHTYERYVNV